MNKKADIFNKIGWYDMRECPVTLLQGELAGLLN